MYALWTLLRLFRKEPGLGEQPVAAGGGTLREDYSAADRGLRVPRRGLLREPADVRDRAAHDLNRGLIASNSRCYDHGSLGYPDSLELV